LLQVVALGFRPGFVGSWSRPKSSGRQMKPRCAIGTVVPPAGVFTTRCDDGSIRPNSWAASRQARRASL